MLKAMISLYENTIPRRPCRLSERMGVCIFQTVVNVNEYLLIKHFLVKWLVTSFFSSFKSYICK